MKTRQNRKNRESDPKNRDKTPEMKHTSKIRKSRQTEESSKHIMQEEYATIIQDQEYDPEDDDQESSVQENSEENSESQSQSQSQSQVSQEMCVSVVKPNPKKEIPKLTIGLSPISKNRKSIHVNDIGLDDTQNQQADFSDTNERSDESSSEYSSSYYSEDEEEDSELSKTQTVTKKTKANGEKTFASISDCSSARTMDSEYEAFIENYGHLDFRLLNFLPTIKTKKQLMEQHIKQLENIKKDRVNEIQGKKPPSARAPKGNLDRIDEEDEEDAFSELYDRSDFVDKYNKKVKAQLFDFKLNNKYYIINITVDEEGERIKAVSNLQGRVVSRTPIQYVPPDVTPVKQKNLPRGTVQIQDQNSKYYFQYRIDELSKSCKENPKICIGICRSDFLVNQDLSRQKNVWCFNLSTGDIFTEKKWRGYFDNESTTEEFRKKNKKPRSNKFVVGTIVGMLVDMDRGIINFYKDGHDLGQAFCATSLKKGPFFPFVQIQEICVMSIFHPSVYPRYRDPMESHRAHVRNRKIVEPEPQPKRSSVKKNKKKRQSVRQSYKEQRMSLTAKQADILAKKKLKDEIKISVVSNIEESKRDSQASSARDMNQSFSKQLAWNNLSKMDKKSVDSSHDSFLDKLKLEKFQIQEQDNLLQQVRESHRLKEEQAEKDEQFYSVTKVDEDLEINVLELDMNKLIIQKNEDILQIEMLQQKVEEYSNRITVGDVNNLNFGSSSKSFMTTESQREHIQGLQYEIEKNMKEIELLKQKLQVKNQVLGNFQGRNSYVQRGTFLGGLAPECGLFCGMGDTTGRSTIRSFMEKERSQVEPQRETRGILSEFGFGHKKDNVRPTMQFKDPNLMQECNIF